MANWPIHNFLARNTALAFSVIFGALLLPLSAVANPQDRNSDGHTEVINPELDRRDVNYKRIDNEIIEITPVLGFLSIEDFDTSELFGLRVGVHLNEYLFVEASYVMAEGDRTSYEELSGSSATIFSDSDREYNSLDASLGINLFTGESWIFGNAYSSNFYLLIGAGTTEFGGDDWMTINVGAGYRLFLNDWMALRLDVRDHIFNRDVFIDNEQTHNIELSTSLSFFF